MKLEKNKLIPTTGMHLKDINSGEIAEGYIFLGIYDSPNNYIEVTESEYQQYLIDKENEAELEQHEEH
jgi:hypothetical protein